MTGRAWLPRKRDMMCVDLLRKRARISPKTDQYFITYNTDVPHMGNRAGRKHPSSCARLMFNKRQDRKRAAVNGRGRSSSNSPQVPRESRYEGYQQVPVGSTVPHASPTTFSGLKDSRKQKRLVCFRLRRRAGGRVCVCVCVLYHQGTAADQAGRCARGHRAEEQGVPL